MSLNESISPAYVPDAYPTNAQGLTYGSYADRTMYGYAPELVSVQGDEGNSGYVHLNEFRTAKNRRQPNRLRFGRETELIRSPARPAKSPKISWPKLLKWNGDFPSTE